MNKNIINTLLLSVISICLLKIAFFNESIPLQMGDKSAVTFLSDGSSKEIQLESVQDVRVWNGRDYEGHSVNLRVYCVNCN